MPAEQVGIVKENYLWKVSGGGTHNHISYSIT